MTLRIQLLGDFRVSVGGVAVDESRWVRKKAETLVKLLAVEPGHEIHRDRLLEILWPELDVDQALNNLHKAVHAARRALEPELKTGAESRFIATNDRRVSLRSGDAESLWIDLEVFEREAKRTLASPETAAPEIEAVLRGMTGELLPADRLEDWAAVRREQVAGLHQELLMRLASLQERAGDPRRATELLRQAINTQPANEQAHRQLMRLYAATGQRHLAVSQFRICCETLRKELDAEPESATVRLYEQIQGGQIFTPPDEPLRASVPLAPAPVPASASRRKLLFGAGGVASCAAVAWLARDRSTPPPVRKTVSLAVLPLTIAPAAPIAHIADGLTEGLIGSLTQLPRLRVMARSTVFAYQDRIADPRALAKAVGVTTILTGRVEEAKENLQIAVELVDATDGARLWGKRYLFAPSERPAMATRVASDVASALSYAFDSPAQRQQLARQATENPQAYELYLRGRQHWNQRNEAGFRRAIEFFEQAISVDPRYALAYSGLADCYGLLGFESAPPVTNLPKARAMASKALELDDQLAEGHTSLAMLKALYDWDWPRAESAFRRAIELNPGHATAHHWYAVFLNQQGRTGEAKARFARALDLDPLSPIINTNAGYPAHYQRDYPGAIRIYRQVLELNPSFQIARKDLILALEQAGQLDEAAAEVIQFLQQAGDVDLAKRFQLVRPRSGYRDGLKAWREQVEARARRVYVSPATLAEFAIRTGDHDAAFRYLNLAADQRSAPLAYLKVNPLYDPIRADPRFGPLLGRVGLN